MPPPAAAATAAYRAETLANACKGAKATPTGWQACCPAHEDTHPSLSIGYTQNKVLLHCHTGCSIEAICAALMVNVADLFCGERKGKLPILATYDYTDEYGTLLFQVCRLADKTFPQRHPDPASPDRWIWGIKGIRRVLYHLPDVLAAMSRHEPIYITEGEKDCDNLRALGLNATCNPMGASKKQDKGMKWLASYSESLRGAVCSLLPDHDEDGQTHMETVARHLHGTAASVKIVPGIHTAKKGSDVSDWLAAGGTLAQLLTAAAAAPPWVPTPIACKAAAPTSTNGTHPPTPAPPDSFDPDRLYTDSYNARALVKEHGLNLRYCYPWKCWLVWTGTHWQRDTSGLVMRLAKQSVKALAKLLPTLDDKQAFALLAHIKSSLSTAKLKAMLESAQSEEGIAVQPEELDRDLWLLNCANGTIDLRTGKLREATRQHLLTKCLSIPYDPYATCPKWEAFLTRAMENKQGLVAFLHRAIGYSLTGSTIEQCLFILHGPTKTGKTTFLARLRALLGPYGTQADMESFMHKDKSEVRNDLADLAGRRIVCAVESQEGRRLNESLIKQLTGGVDVVKARFLFEEYFTYAPQYKIFLASNHKPVIKDTDQAIWERIRLVPFIVQIPVKERDKKLDEALQQELPGILAWAVRGCLAWQHRGDLGEPPEVLDATKAWQEESDVIGRFLTERCDTNVVKNPQLEVQAKPLYDAYKEWCDTNGERFETQTTFSRQMVERGYEKKPGHFVMYRGVALLPLHKTGEESEKPTTSEDNDDLPC